MNKLIMITRPAHQAGPLTERIEATGGHVFLFPTLAILPARLEHKDKEILKQINAYDILIFISPNAVEHGLDQIQRHKILSSQILLATIGQGSARVLHQRLGKEPDIVPEESFSSEGLLATPAMQNVKNKRILIIRGNSGREHLKQILKQRGATVDYLNVYMRLKPETHSTELEQYLHDKQIAAIVITSAEGLNNLFEMVPEKVKSMLLQIPLIIINSRLLSLAEQMKFKTILTAKNADDEAIIEALKQNKLLS